MLGDTPGEAAILVILSYIPSNQQWVGLCGSLLLWLSNGGFSNLPEKSEVLKLCFMEKKTSEINLTPTQRGTFRCGHPTWDQRTLFNSVASLYPVAKTKETHWIPVLILTWVLRTLTLGKLFTISKIISNYIPFLLSTLSSSIYLSIIHRLLSLFPSIHLW